MCVFICFVWYKFFFKGQSIYSELLKMTEFIQLTFIVYFFFGFNLVGISMLDEKRLDHFICVN